MVKTKIIHSVVRDIPGCPVAAPCAIDGCRYWRLARVIEGAFGLKKGAPLPTTGRIYIRSLKRKKPPTATRLKRAKKRST